MVKYMKKICLILMVCIFAASLAGCTQMVTTIDIKTDGSADVMLKAGMAEEVYAMFANGDTDILGDTKKEAEDMNYTVEEYNEDGYVGLKMTSHIENLERIPESDKYIEGLVFTKSGDLFNKEMSLTGTLASVTSLKQNMEDSSINTADFDLKLVVSVPYPITDTNAALISEDNKTATFDLLADDNINLVCAKKAVLFGVIPVTWASIVVIVLAAAVVALIIIGFFKKRKLIKAMETKEEEED